MERFIRVRHNMEVAHRLFLQPGKCQNIHGHSMQVELTLRGDIDEQGIFAGIDFSDLKKVFRSYIDTRYDHRLLLNINDPYAGNVSIQQRNDDGTYRDNDEAPLPGIRVCEGDPTTEHLVEWIAKDMRDLIYERWPDSRQMIYEVYVEITETGTNGAAISIGTVR